MPSFVTTQVGEKLSDIVAQYQSETNHRGGKEGKGSKGKGSSHLFDDISSEGNTDSIITIYR